MPVSFRVVGAEFLDSPNIDAFGRMRVSDPVTLFDSQLQYNALPLLWETVLVGGGSATHLPNESSIRMRCGTASGDKVTRQSRQYLRYQPGKSQLIVMTGMLGAAKANVRQCIGYFDSKNGIFFEQLSSGTGVVQRAFITGSTVDIRIAQADWNLDKMDGTGPSGITLDFAKTQIFTIDLEWLGVGRQRMGFNVNGRIIYCHEFLNSNNLSTVYMTTANLPLRYEITNLDTTASNTDLIQICSTVIAEGGLDDERGLIGSASNGITGISVTTRRPILSIRPRATFNSITNRTISFPTVLEVFAVTNNAFWELVYDGTLTNASFNNVNTANSTIEFDIAASAISGGVVLASGFVDAGGAPAKIGRTSADLASKLTMTSNIAADDYTPVSLVCTSFSATATCHGSLGWKELY